MPTVAFGVGLASSIHADEPERSVPRASIEQASPPSAPGSARHSTAAPSNSAPVPLGVRVLVQRHWQPKVDELQENLEKLRKTPPESGKKQEIRRRIEDLEQKVGRLQQHVQTAASRLEQLRATRAERRTASLERLREQWGPALGRTEVRRELRQHARRSARLHRAQTVAEQSNNAGQLDRARRLLAKENARHQRVMRALMTRSTAPDSSGGH